MRSAVVMLPLDLNIWSNMSISATRTGTFLTHVDLDGNAAKMGAIGDGMRLHAINGKDVAGLDTKAIKGLVSSSITGQCWVKAWVDNHGYHSALARAGTMGGVVIVEPPHGMLVAGSAEEGFFVAECTPGGNAARAGVLVGMMITHINEHDLSCSKVVQTEADASSALAESKFDGCVMVIKESASAFALCRERQRKSEADTTTTAFAILPAFVAGVAPV